jgi:hypothetical protein
VYGHSVLGGADIIELRHPGLTWRGPWYPGMLLLLLLLLLLLRVLLVEEGLAAPLSHHP